MPATVFLQRYGCGHYEVQLSTPFLAAGFHAGEIVGVRVVTSDGDCIICEAHPGLKASPPLRQLADNRLIQRLRLLACHRRP